MQYFVKDGALFLTAGGQDKENHNTHLDTHTEVIGTLLCLSHLGLQIHKPFAWFFVFLKTHASGRSMFPWKKKISCFIKCAQSAMDYLQCLSHKLMLSRFFSPSICPPCGSNLFSKTLRKQRIPTLGEEWALTNGFSLSIRNVHIHNKLPEINPLSI